MSGGSYAIRGFYLQSLISVFEMVKDNKRENFEDNKRFLRSRMEQEQNPVVRKLLEKNLSFLDRIQVQMATAREF